MNTIRPDRWWPRYHPELSPSGQPGIRDRQTDALHRAASVEDAHIDAAYLNSQVVVGNLPEVARHLAFVAEQARSPRPVRPAPTNPPRAEVVLHSASEWEAARLASVAANAEVASVRFHASLRRALEHVRTDVDLAAAAVVDAIARLYADPLPAQRVLSDTSTAVPLPELAALVRSEPAVFGALAEPPARRFGPAAATAEVAARAERLAVGLESLATAELAFWSARSAAAAAVDAEPTTAPEDLARALESRSRRAEGTPGHDPRPHFARASDRLRALLAIADENTTAEVLQRFPESSTLVREARARTSISHAPEL